MHLDQLASPWRPFVGRPRKPRAATRPRRYPRLEELENRITPVSFTSQVYVASLYQALLEHNPDPVGVAVWGGALDAGVNPVQVVSGILNSAEYRGREVEVLYETLLGRQADLSGINGFSNAIASGTSLDQVRADILGSDEFFAHAGGTPQGFLNALYLAVLNRAPDPSAEAFLTSSGSLFDVRARTQVALQVVNSPEAAALEVNNIFAEILGRLPDPPSASSFVQALTSGIPDQAVFASVLGSPEFIGRLVGATATADQSDPNGASLQFIGSNGLFFTNQTTVSASQRILDPAFGIISLPPGYNIFSPSTGLGTFGANGFTASGGTSNQGNRGTSGTGGTGTAGTGTGGTGTGGTGTGGTGTGGTTGGTVGGGTTLGTATVGTTGTTGVTGPGGTTGGTTTGGATTVGTTGTTGVSGPGGTGAGTGGGTTGAPGATGSGTGTLPAGTGVVGATGGP